MSPLPLTTARRSALRELLGLNVESLAADIHRLNEIDEGGLRDYNDIIQPRVADIEYIIQRLGADDLRARKLIARYETAKQRVSAFLMKHYEKQIAVVARHTFASLRK